MLTGNDHIPYRFRGHWGFWTVQDQIDVECSIASPNLRQTAGLYGGFDADRAGAWRNTLPSLRNVRYLVSWTGGNGQKLVDAILRMTWLQRLCFGGLRAHDISGIGGLTKLEYLCVHQLQGAKDLHAIAELERLHVLELGINQSVQDLNWIQGPGLKQLRSLIIYGNRARFPISDLTALRNLTSLEYVSIPTIRPAKLSLFVFLDLPNLKALHLRAENWDETELQSLQDRKVRITIGPIRA